MPPTRGPPLLPGAGNLFSPSVQARGAAAAQSEERTDNIVYKYRYHPDQDDLQNRGVLPNSQHQFHKPQSRSDYCLTSGEI